MRSRLDRNYFSLYERMATQGLHLRVPYFNYVQLLPMSLVKKFDKKFYPHEREFAKINRASYNGSKRRVPTYYSDAIQFTPLVGQHATNVLGGLQSVLDMTKELQDTVTRYKSMGGSRSHLMRDIYLPARAIGNILAGVLTIVGVAPVLILSVVNAAVNFSCNLA